MPVSPCERPWSEVMTTFFEKFRQNAQILKSRVSVSNFKYRVSVSEFLMKSRSRLEILTRSLSRRLRSRLHHWLQSLQIFETIFLLHKAMIKMIIKMFYCL